MLLCGELQADDADEQQTHKRKRGIIPHRQLLHRFCKAEQSPADADTLNAIVDEVKKHNMSIVDIEITKSRPSEGTQLSAILSLQFKKKIPHENVMAFISEVPGVATVEEL